MNDQTMMRSFANFVAAMTSPVIHLTATPEPGELHGQPAGLFQAVGLSLEAQGDETVAKGHHETFLQTLPAQQFALLEIVDTGPGDAATFVFAGMATVIAPDTTLFPNPDEEKTFVFDWITERQGILDGAGRPADARFWASPDHETDTEGVAQVEMGATGAVDLEQSAIGWVAPVPQAAGLIRLVQLPNVNLGSPHVLVPVLWNNADQYDYSGTYDKDRREALVKYTMVDPDTYDELSVACATPVLDPYTPLDGKGANTVFGDDGWLTPDPTAAALYRMRGRIAREGPSQLWVLPVLADVVADVVAGEEEINEGNVASILEATLCTLFDPFLAPLAWDPSSTRKSWLREYLVTVASDAILAAADGSASPLADLPTSEEIVEVFDALLKTQLLGLLSPITDNEPHPLWAFLDTAMAAMPGDAPPVLGERAPLCGRFFNLMKSENIAAKNAEAMMQEMVDLCAMMEDEGALEAMLLTLMKYACGADGKALARAVGHDPLAPFVLIGMQAFQRFLEQKYNLAMAARQAHGRVLTHLLMADRNDPVLTPDRLKVTLVATDWFLSRCGLEDKDGGTNDGGAFKPLLAHLPMPVGEWKDGVIFEAVKVQAETAFTKAHATLTNDRREKESFRPDLAPEPIVLRLGQGLDPDELDNITKAIAGFGIVIERRDGALTGVMGYEPEAAHASLVRVVAGDGGNEFVSIQPAQLANNGGEAQLFVPYEGLPLNGLHQPETSHGAAQEDARERKLREAAKPPYQLAQVGATQLTLPSPLVYGYDYRAQAFWLPNSGAVPASLRDSDPWTLADPKRANLDTLGGPWETYLRRTTIAQMEIVDAADTPRIGWTPKDVFPLSRDYPRLSLSRSAMGATSIDLFRNADGTGIDWARDQEFTLHEVVADKDAVLGVEFWQSPHGDPDKPAAFAKDDQGNIRFKAPADGNYWMRLSLTDGKQMSFADPSADLHGGGRGDKEPLCLIARDTWKEDAETKKKTGTAWMPELKEEVTFSFAPPGIGFADLECWLSNPVLGAVACGDRDPTDLLKALRLARDLLQAMGPDYLDALKAQKPELATEIDLLRPRCIEAWRQINQLPDPAVSALLVTLEPNDGYDGHDAGEALSFTHGVTPYQTVDPTVLIGLLDDPARATAFGALDAAIRLASGLHEAARTTATIGSDLKIKVDAKSIDLPVPEGAVTRLRIAPLVNADLFHVNGTPGNPARPFAAEIGDLATADYRDGTRYRVFPGTSLLIEAMVGLEGQSLDLTAFKVAPIDQARAYALTLSPDTETATDWHRFSHADVATQRQRHTGRPIYNWVDPVRPGETPKNPVVDMTHRERPEDIEAFEADAYLGRSNEDADHKRFRLTPLPAPSPLGRHEWSAPSATWLRHRYRVHSRYRGAIAKGTRSLASWHAAGDDALPWTTRVAFLADLGQAALTRPQLRSYIPSLGNTDATAAEAPPPIICVLSEPPQSQLGLADRVVSALETVHCYAFRTKNSKEVLGLNDLRREVGPDPRLSYTGIGAEASRDCRLRAEGPVGLHFDARATQAPAFANCQYLLHLDLPVGADGDRQDLEESFAGVTLMRHADPGWSWSPPRIPGEAAPRCWWLDCADLKLGPTTLGNETSDVVKMTRHANTVTFEICGTAAYDDNGADWVTLGVIDLDHECPSILHQTLSEDRHALCLLASPAEPDVTARGDVDRPQLIARIEYKASGQMSLSDPDMRSVPSRASQATFVEWTRTQRNRAVYSDGSNRVSTKALTAVLEEDAGRIHFRHGADQIRLQSPVNDRRYPLHLRRHLAVVLRKPSLARGRPVHLYHQAYLTAPDGSVTLREKDLPDGATACLAEFETRAEILASQGTQGAEKYGKAVFDLVSTDDYDGVRLLYFDLRAANRFLQPSEELTLTINGETRVLTVGAQTPTDRLSFSGLLGGGADRVSVTLTSTGDNLWCDLSMLHSSTSNEAGDHSSPMDFNWFFGTHSDEPDLQDATSPARLNTLTEAQARLISLSPPITIARA